MSRRTSHTPFLYDKPTFYTVSHLKYLENEISSLEREYKDKETRLHHSLQNQLDYAKREMEQATESVRLELEKCKQKNKELLKSNQNMSYITKDRANAQRKIPNKKAHDGYLLHSMEDFSYLHKHSGNVPSLPFTAFKVKFQSPYNHLFEYNTVKERIDQDLIQKLGKKLGIKRHYKDNSIQSLSYDDFLNTWKQDCFIFHTSYKLNGAKKFWEVEFWINKPIVIPDDMFQ